jgi:hypothetical protein
MRAFGADDSLVPLRTSRNTPPAWMMTPYIAFLFPVPFSARVTTAERYWVTLAKHRSPRPVTSEIPRRFHV